MHTTDVAPTARPSRLFWLLPVAIWALLLLLLPLFPTQDGPTHLLTGDLIFDLWQGSGAAPDYYSWRATKLTNQLGNLVLGGLLELGIAPRWAEGLFQLLLLGLIALAWRRLLARAGAAPWGIVFVLLPFMGQVLHQGYYNFLLGVHLGVLGWCLRRPGAKNPASDALFALSLYAHPLGAAAWLGLVVFQRLCERRWRDLLLLLPHALLFAWIWRANAGGRVPDVLPRWPDFFGQSWIAYRETLLPTTLLHAVSAALVVLLLASVVLHGRRSDGGARKTRLFLFAAALPALLASGLMPDHVGEAVGAQMRGAYFAWILLLPALAPVRGQPRYLGATALLLAAVLFGTNAVADLRLAREQDEYLRRLPAPPAGATALYGHDAYSPEEALVNLGLHPLEAFVERRGGVIAYERRPHFNPWMHVLDRWALEHGLVSLFDHQAFYTHSPIEHRDPPASGWRGRLDYSCSQLPLDGMQGAADYILFANLPEGWWAAAQARLPAGLRVRERGDDWVLFEGGGDPRPQARLSAAFYTEGLPALAPPWPLPLPLHAGQRVVPAAEFVPAYAKRPFVAFVVEVATGRFRRADPGELRPSTGICDGEASFVVEHADVPPGWQPVLVLR